ncbi:MAG: hypothetical protein RLZZ480_287 [Candidatus Parcubacteria bacterium]|jgi:hypothetical protein
MTLQGKFPHLNVTIFGHPASATMSSVNDDLTERQRHYKEREGSRDSNRLELRSQHVIVTVHPGHPHCTPGQKHFVLSCPGAELGDRYANISAQFLSLVSGDEVVEDIVLRHTPHVHCDIITLTLWSTKLMLRYELPLVLEHKVTTA